MKAILRIWREPKNSVDPRGSRQETMHSCKSGPVARFVQVKVVHNCTCSVARSIKCGVHRVVGRRLGRGSGAGGGNGQCTEKLRKVAHQSAARKWCIISTFNAGSSAK